MADVITKTKTNYFKTNNPTKLKLLIDSLKTDGEPVVLTRYDDSFMFYCNGDIEGVLTEDAIKNLEQDADWVDDHPDEAWSYDKFLEDLRLLVASGDACVIKTIGHEAMRDIWADAYIITSRHIEHLDFSRLIKDRVRLILNDNTWNLHNPI